MKGGKGGGKGLEEKINCMFHGREWSLSSRKTRELFKNLSIQIPIVSRQFFEIYFSVELPDTNSKLSQKYKPISKMIFGS